MALALARHLQLTLFSPRYHTTPLLFVPEVHFDLVRYGLSNRIGLMAAAPDERAESDEAGGGK